MFDQHFNAQTSYIFISKTTLYPTSSIFENRIILSKIYRVLNFLCGTYIWVYLDKKN